MKHLEKRIDLLERIVIEMGSELKGQYETWFALGDLVAELKELRALADEEVEWTPDES